MPADWAEGVIIRIPKKGALSDCNNWRGITLLSVPSNILAKIILKRISDALDVGLRKKQAAQIRALHYATSLNNALNGRGSCTSILLTLRKHLTASTEIVYDAFWEPMRFP